MDHEKNLAAARAAFAGAKLTEEQRFALTGLITSAEYANALEKARAEAFDYARRTIKANVPEENRGDWWTGVEWLHAKTGECVGHHLPGILGKL